MENFLRVPTQQISRDRFSWVFRSLNMLLRILISSTSVSQIAWIYHESYLNCTIEFDATKVESGTLKASNGRSYICALNIATLCRRAIDNKLCVCVHFAQHALIEWILCNWLICASYVFSSSLFVFVCVCVRRMSNRRWQADQPERQPQSLTFLSLNIYLTRRLNANSIWPKRPPRWFHNRFIRNFLSFMHAFDRLMELMLLLLESICDQIYVHTLNVSECFSSVSIYLRFIVIAVSATCNR